MPLRDDHEAAIARADALQVELDAQRAKDQIDAARVAELERELGDARERLARAEAQLAILKPAPQEPASTTASAQESKTGLVIGFAVVGALMIALLIALGQENAARREARPPPAPPFEVDQLVAAAQAEVHGAPIQEMWINYVDETGTLDPAHGSLNIEATEAPTPPAPDDPTRKTGAPSSNDMPVSNCLTAHWDPAAGWAVKQMVCMFRGKTPGVPACKPTAVIAAALADGAPRHALARIHVKWTMNARPHEQSLIWQWTYLVRDPDRGVEVSRYYVELGAGCALDAR